MVELLTLSVERRETVGKRRNRRLRASGKTPAVLYGHKQDVVNLSVATEQVEAALRPRVSEHEHVQLSVPVLIRGEAPGLKDGGVIKQHLHMIEIEAEPINAPENIPVSVNELGFNQQIRVSDVVAPEGVKLLADPEAIVVECVEPVVVEETAAEAEEGAEPEVIGRKKAEEEEAE